MVTLTPDGHEGQICVSTVETPVKETVLMLTPDGQVGQLCVTTTVVAAAGDTTLPEATDTLPEAFAAEVVVFRMEYGPASDEPGATGVFVALSVVVTGNTADVDLTDIAAPLLLAVVGAAAGATPGHEGQTTGA